MNILLVTPIYKVESRPDLIKQSEAIHYLLRGCTDKDKIHVIYIYTQRLHKSIRYVDSKQRAYAKKGYFYNCEGINVALYEFTLFFRQPYYSILNDSQSKKLAKYIKEYLNRTGFQPDICVTHVPSYSFKIWKYMDLKVPKVAVLHQTDMAVVNQCYDRIEEYKRIYNNFFARSYKIYKYFKNILKVSDDILYSGIESPKKLINPTHGRRNKVMRIICVGELISRKNVDIVIKALSMKKDLLNFKLDIYGEGVERDRLEEQAKTLLNENQYQFFGYVSRDKIFENLWEADVFCLTSSNETLGLVYMEAMACGCITIGSKDEGIDGIIKDGYNGFLVHPRDVSELGETILRISNMKDEEWVRIQNNAINTMNYYTEHNASEHYHNLLQSVLELHNS